MPAWLHHFAMPTCGRHCLRPGQQQFQGIPAFMRMVISA